MGTSPTEQPTGEAFIRIIGTFTTRITIDGGIGKNESSARSVSHLTVVDELVDVANRDRLKPPFVGEHERLVTHAFETFHENSQLAAERHFHYFGLDILEDDLLRRVHLDHPRLLGMMPLHHFQGPDYPAIHELHDD